MEQGKRKPLLFLYMQENGRTGQEVFQKDSLPWNGR